MKDCKKHYSEMYETRLGQADCPWCQIDVPKAIIDQLTIERDETKKNNGYSCHVCGALRTECEIMKRASDDATQRTAERCREIATAQMLAPPGAWGNGATFNAEKIARIIKEEYELSD